MGQSTVFLSSVPSGIAWPRTARSDGSGCIVVGYHGTGGLEYATPENGFWFSPEQLEELVDALPA